MNLVWLRTKLVQYKVTIIALVVALVSLAATFFAFLYEDQLGKGLSAAIQHLSLAVLVSMSVGLVYELFLRTAMIELTDERLGDKLDEFGVRMKEESRESLRVELEEFAKKYLGVVKDDNPLFVFWSTFVTEGADIIVAQDEKLGDPIIRAADFLSMNELYSGLLRRFLPAYSFEEIGLRMCALGKGALTERHLIIIGAPGANPWASEVMSEMRGIDPLKGKVESGYVFNVKGQYLESPFIIPVKEDKQVGICDLEDGTPVRIQARAAHKIVGKVEPDCALIVHGRVRLGQRRYRKAMVFAGHSRSSTRAAVRFALENAQWAKKINNLEDATTETLLAVLVEMGELRERYMVGEPRVIQS